mmetsp:Transcript_113836/g.332588  ORF Transcript_113836/g.332588 Transcript_113836/m.332588 type:complete len:98 (+) Transcript_113836:63-356(+)
MRRLPWVVFLLSVGRVLVSALRGGAVGTTDAVSCKTMCQRFGMKKLAEEFEQKGEVKLASEFRTTASPSKCTEVCDQAFMAAAPSSDGELQGAAKTG